MSSRLEKKARNEAIHEVYKTLNMMPSPGGYHSQSKTVRSLGMMSKWVEIMKPYMMLCLDAAIFGDAASCELRVSDLREALEKAEALYEDGRG